MGDYNVIVQQSIEISETCLAAITYIHDQLHKGEMNSYIRMFTDVMEAHYLMERSILSISEQLHDISWEDSTQSMRDALGKVATAFEQGDIKQAQNAISSLLESAYQEWIKVLQQAGTLSRI